MQWCKNMYRIIPRKLSFSFNFFLLIFSNEKSPSLTIHWLSLLSIKKKKKKWRLTCNRRRFPSHGGRRTDMYFPRCEKWHCKRIRFQLVCCRFARFAMPGNGHSFETYHLISNRYNTQINFPIRVDGKTSDWIYIECRYEVQLVINIGIVYSRGKGGGRRLSWSHIAGIAGDSITQPILQI